MNSEHHMARMSEPPVPTLTAEEQEAEALADSIAGCFSNVSDLPEWMRVQALGCYMRPLTLIAARAVIGSEWLRARDEARVSEAVERALRRPAAGRAGRADRAVGQGRSPRRIAGVLLLRV